MDVLYECCAGLDVHKKTVVACVLTPAGQQTRTFPTMTEDLLALGDWLVEHGVTHVAMESTGVYWKPVYNVLEGVPSLTVWVVNAQHIKAVPGRKTDVKDSQWIADLLRHGLVRPSFIPDRPQREVRELVRYRRTLIEERARAANRIQQVLEAANLKLGSVASDVLGKSGRAMLHALAEGQTDPVVLADLAVGKLAEKRVDLVRALQGKVGAHQRLLLASHLRHLDFLEEELARLSTEVQERLAPFDEAIDRLDAIPGIGRTVAEEVLAETGTDMSRFPTAAHLCSWARVSPGNNESAGKRKSGRTGHGNRWLRSALVQAAHAAARKKDSYLRAQYQRLTARRGGKRAAIAVAHSILRTIYFMLTRGTEYHDLGILYFDEHDRQRTVQRAKRRIERLGYKVTVEERETA
jgi:transposase